MDIIYQDADIIVCIKPAGVLSTDEPGGMPSLLRETLEDPKADVRTVHRLDRVVSGLMVFARSSSVASELSRQITDRTFEKYYLAVVHGAPQEKEGIYRDLLFREASENKTYVVKRMRKGVREAALEYRTEGQADDLSLVRIHLLTGRTHQIRAQFSSRQMPLVGDRKYSINNDGCEIALWSCQLQFNHPKTGKRMEFKKNPPECYPWTVFDFPVTPPKSDDTITEKESPTRKALQYKTTEQKKTGKRSEKQNEKNKSALNHRAVRWSKSNTEPQKKGKKRTKKKELPEQEPVKQNNLKKKTFGKSSMVESTSEYKSRKNEGNSYGRITDVPDGRGNRQKHTGRNQAVPAETSRQQGK